MTSASRIRSPEATGSARRRRQRVEVLEAALMAFLLLLPARVPFLATVAAVGTGLTGIALFASIVASRSGALRLPPMPWFAGIAVGLPLFSVLLQGRIPSSATGYLAAAAGGVVVGILFSGAHRIGGGDLVQALAPCFPIVVLLSVAVQPPIAHIYSWHGIYGNENGHGLVLMVTGLALVARSASRSRMRNTLVWFGCLALTASVTSVLAGLIGLALVCTSSQRVGRAVVNYSTLAASLVLVLGATGRLPEQFERQLLWQDALTFSLEHPVLGDAVEAGQLLSQSTVGRVGRLGEVHNSWLSLAVTFGPPVAVMMFLAFRSAIVSALRKSRPTAALALALTVTMMSESWILGPRTGLPTLLVALMCSRPVPSTRP